MNVFGSNSSSKFGFGTDQGIDSTVSGMRLSSQGSVVSAVLNMNDGRKVAASIDLSGISYSGPIDCNNNGIVNVPDPTEATDVANKRYVDQVVAGLTVKAPARVATTANVTLSSVLTGSVIDGVTLALNDRILVKDQTTKTQNGVYTVKSLGLQRSADMDNVNPSNEIGGGTFVFVSEGSVNGKTGWLVTSPTGIANLGSDNIVWTRFSAFTYSAGTGLTESNNSFSVSYGSSSGTSCEGNDSRLSNSRKCNNTFDDAATSRSNLGLGGLATLSAPSSGYVKSNGSALSSVSTVPSTDVSGLGGLATLNVPSSGYVKSNGSALSAVTSVPSTDVSGLGSLATLNVPSSGYVKSSGSALTSVSSIPSSDITGLTAYDPSNVAITGGNARLSFLETNAGTHTSGTQHIGILNGGNTRWALGMIHDESGGNTGSNLALWGYSDTNNWLRTAMIVSRETGVVEFPQPSQNTFNNVVWSAGGTRLGTLGYTNSGDDGLLCLTNGGDDYTGLNLRGRGHSSIVDGSLGIGSNMPTSRRLTLYPETQVPALQITTDTDNLRGGVHLYTDRTSQAIISGGGIYDGPAGGWIAGAAGSSGIDMSDGQMIFWCNTGLTPDTSFSPNYSAVLTTGGLTIPSGKSITTPSMTASGAISYNSGYYPVGNHLESQLKVYRCVVDMQNKDIAHGTGFTTVTALSSPGSVLLMYSSFAFSSNPTVVLTPSYAVNPSVPLSVAARINNEQYEHIDGCKIETFNTGTGGVVSVDATGKAILLHVMVIGQ